MLIHAYTCIYACTCIYAFADTRPRCCATTAEDGYGLLQLQLTRDIYAYAGKRPRCWATTAEDGYGHDKRHASLGWVWDRYA